MIVGFTSDDELNIRKVFTCVGQWGRGMNIAESLWQFLNLNIKI